MARDDPGDAAPGPPTATVVAAERGLDALNLFVANVQTGFGPFLSVYLTTQGWTQTGIGLALSIGTVVAMASQIPAGALVDATDRKAHVAAGSILAFTVSALLFTIAPVALWVYLAQVLHAFASCTLGPSIAAISLVIAGKGALGPRLGRNARFASIGTGLGAALLGLCGYYISERAVFFATAVLTLPALLALLPLFRLNYAVLRPSPRPLGAERRERRPLHLLLDRRLLIFAGCAALFTLANSAMLPLASSAITRQAPETASLLIAGCIVLPQLIVAVISPGVGRMAEARGRKLLLFLGFSILPLRGALLAVTVEVPPLVLLVQALDGIAAACFGVLLPLVTADIAGRSGHFTLCLGFVGFAVGIGATLSTALGGYIADGWGDSAAFLALAATGGAALLTVWLAMPETRTA